MWYHIGCIGAVFPGGIRAIVAQLDRAFGSDPEGQRFESSRSHQKGMTFLRHAFFLCLFLHAGVLSGSTAAVQTAADFLCSLSAYFTDL